MYVPGNFMYKVMIYRRTIVEARERKIFDEKDDNICFYFLVSTDLPNSVKLFAYSWSIHDQ